MAQSQEEVVHAKGHSHVQATHSSTFELTSDDWLTSAGDCILGIEADRTPTVFSESFVKACKSQQAKITATFSVGNYREQITGYGHPDLTFTNDRSLVGRTSTYVDDRTIMIRTDKAAKDIDRALIAELKDGAAMTCVLKVKPAD